MHCDVAVIGAGPYGLSAGAHLKAKGIAVRVFGEPMEFWANKMPEGMLLRSPRWRPICPTLIERSHWKPMRLRRRKSLARQFLWTPS